MTISSTTLRNTYTGNASTTVFAYTFRIFAEGDLLVTVDGVTQTLTTDYTVSGVGDLNGGNVTFLTAPASSTSIVLLNNLSFIQDIDYNELDAFPAESHEEGLDKAAARDLILQEQTERTIKYGSGTSTTDATVAEPTDGQLLQFSGTTGAIVGVALGSLSDNLDVTLTSLADNDILAYNSSGAVFENKAGATKDNISATLINEYTDTVITAADEILFGDTTDSNNMKKDTVQGILDLVSEDRILLTTQTASASASLDFTSSIDSTYNNYIFEFTDLIPATTNQDLQVRIGDGSFLTTLYGYGVRSVNGVGGLATDNSASATTINLTTTGVANTSTEGISGRLVLTAPSNSSTAPRLYFDCVWFNDIATNGPYRCFGAGSHQTAANVSRLQFFFASGNITSGTVKMYGVT